jgi:trehalose 6-phosphate synthase/phosphatase
MRLIIVSNRAPVNIIKEGGSFSYEASAGGLASGLRAYVEKMQEDSETEIEIVWIGWPGATVKEEDKEQVRAEILKQFKVHSVFLEEEMMEKFYEGFCNKTIWPLFHYFPALAVYDKEFWEQYQVVNEVYCKAVMEVVRPSDIIWVHDYHLMLLPAMIRKQMATATIGFFLHIPFPTFEVYRLLPGEWRKKILEGLYGADLIGFHTHDYSTYFLRSTSRIIGLHSNMGELYHGSRLVKVDTFPMGIDYRKYHDAVSSKNVKKEKEKLKKSLPGQKIILSIDRQDYSKGILNRLRGYEKFLETSPQWKKKVVMMMIVIPSRIGVENYQVTKSRIDELVGRINGIYGAMDWIPIHYHYQSVSFDELIALYNISDVALVTPLRDGMNLIAKEFIASKTDNKGVLILSEMAGASDELAESLIINPNNIDEIASSLVRALEMYENEQGKRLEVMQRRLMSYDVFKWADDFITTLEAIKKKQQRLSAKTLHDTTRKKIISQFKKNSSRIIFLDYDGTLVPFAGTPQEAIPSAELISLLGTLSKKSEIILVSGRDRNTLEQWFGKLEINIIGEHGLFIRERNGKWKMLKPVRKNWKKKIIPIMNRYVEKLPAAFVEEKEFSVVFHYRRSDPAFAEQRVKELMNHLISFTTNIDVQVLSGNMALEVRNSGVDKGVAAMRFLDRIKKQPRFILAIGDDLTDEDLFRVMPRDAYSIKVGLHPSYAMYNLNNSYEVIEMLKELTASVLRNS